MMERIGTAVDSAKPVQATPAGLWTGDTEHPNNGLMWTCAVCRKEPKTTKYLLSKLETHILDKINTKSGKKCGQ